MPQAIETHTKWTEKFAWWPVKSSFSKKYIWLKPYHVAEIFYDAMGRPPVKAQSWTLTYSDKEYVLYLLRAEDNTKDLEGEWKPRYPSRVKQWRHMMME
tara:strand:- start:1396 stop:1692 length:297 start_codon:yes stop_codon:yes gene_type:complete